MSSNQDDNALNKRILRNTGRSNSNGDLSTDSLRVLLREQKDEIIQSVSHKVDELSLKVSELISKFNHLEDKVTLLCKRQDEQQVEIDNLKMLIGNVPDPEFLIQEIQQRVDRSNNLIVSGLQEKASGSVEDRTRHDLAEFQHLCEVIDVPEVKVEKCFRIGARRQDENRLLKVSLKERSDRNSILRKAKSLRNCGEFEKVYVTPDRTQSQRLMHKKMRLELKRRRDEGDEVVIYRGRIQSKSSLKNFRQ